MKVGRGPNLLKFKLGTVEEVPLRDPIYTTTIPLHRFECQSTFVADTREELYDKRGWKSMITSETFDTEKTNGEGKINCGQ